MKNAPNIAPPKAREQGHWYWWKRDHEGPRWDQEIEPMHARGKTYGLREARKDNESGKCILPSVTTILGTRYSYPLDLYSRTKVAEAAWELSRWEISHGSPEREKQEWVDAVLWDAKLELRDASEHGSYTHAAIESFLNGESVMPEYYNICCEVERILKDECPEICGIERMIGCDQGYAGTVDVFGVKDRPTVIDFKTRKTTPDRKPAIYPKDRQQIAAYGFACFGDDYLNNGHGGNIIISSTEKDRVEFVAHDPNDSRRWYNCFGHSLLSWELEKDYNPNLTGISYGT